MKNEKRVYAMALMKWGYKAQEEKFLEELAEVNHAYWDFKKDRKNDGLESRFIEELVDAHLMINQIAMYYDWGYFQEYKEKKLMELEKRLLDNTKAEFMAALAGYEETVHPPKADIPDDDWGADKPMTETVTKQKRELPPAKYMGKEGVDYCMECGTNYNMNEYQRGSVGHTDLDICIKCMKE